MFKGPNATSSRTVGENTWASEFWKMNPTRPRNAARELVVLQVVFGDVGAERR